MINLSNNEIKNLANKYGTPLFVYDENKIQERIDLINQSFEYNKFKTLYSIKANSNIELLKIVRQNGCHADASSPGDVFMAMTAGFKPDEIFATGPNWTDEDLQYFVKNKIFVFLDSLSHIKRMGKIKINQKIGLRINPGIGCGFHGNVFAGGPESKLGIPIKDFDSAVKQAQASGLIITGLHFHIGSGCRKINVFLEALKKIIVLANRLESLEVIDLGGGYGCKKEGEEHDFDMKKFGQEALKIIKNNYRRWPELKIFLESGEFIMWPCACAITRVNTIKNNGQKKFAGIDLNSNHVPGPMLYGTCHPVININENKRLPKEKINIAGNLCAAGDILAKNRIMSKLKEGNLLIFQNVGAYYTVRQSRFNSRLGITEILKRKNNKFSIIHKEKIEDLLTGQVYEKS